MSKQNLGKARGLNSIANPSEFRGKSARPPRKARRTPEDSPENTQENPEQTSKTPEQVVEGDIDLQDNRSTGDAPEAPPQVSGADQTASTVATEPPTDTEVGAPPKRRGRPPVTGQRRIRRELSVPVAVADAVEQTGINPADLVMNAYRRHSDDVYTGDGARLAARGRKRLRISLSDGDFDKISRLGEARNWNRSETVSVLLSLDLLPEAGEPTPTTGN